MKTLRLTLALLALTTVAGIAYVAQQAESSGPTMMSAAQGFVGSLTADQKKQATFDFDSD